MLCQIRPIIIPLFFLLDPSEFALCHIHMGIFHAYFIAAEKVAISLDVVFGLENDLAPFHSYGICQQEASSPTWLYSKRQTLLY